MRLVLRTLYKLDLDIGNDVYVVLDSETLRFLAAVLPFWVEDVAVGEIEVAGYGVVVEEVVFAPLLVEVEETLLANRAKVSWVPDGAHT